MRSDSDIKEDVEAELRWDPDVVSPVASIAESRVAAGDSPISLA